MSNFNYDIGQIDLGQAADIDGFLGTTSSEQPMQSSQQTILQSIGIKSGSDFDLQSIEAGGPSAGIDALFQQQPQMVQASDHRRRVASLGDLSSFIRLSGETLIHRSQKDLWALKKEADGSFFIERLFDDNGSPLKG